MGIARIGKVIIASHRSEASELLESLQDAGIVQVLNAEKAMVSKEWPELHVDVKRPRELEEKIGRLEKSIDFLKGYAAKGAGAVSALRPLAVVEKEKYASVTDGKEALELLDRAEGVESEIDRLKGEYEGCLGRIEFLLPWESLETPVEQINEISSVTCIAGLIPRNNVDEVTERIGESGAVVENMGVRGNLNALVVVCPNQAASQVQKLLRSADFETINFEPMEGTVSELLKETRVQLEQIRQKLETAKTEAGGLAEGRLSLQILFDHCRNLLQREHTRESAPASEHVILLEAWVKDKDHDRLMEITERFPSSSISKMEIAEGETIPVEIENKRAFRPFEVITRLYGMPQHFEVDPTVLLMPFFAVFFALCLTDAGYGLIIIGFSAYLIKQMQGDKKLMMLLLICSVLTLGAGAMTGGWFGNGLRELGVAYNIEWMVNTIDSMVWFDPLKNPMTFFVLAIALGYFQIMFGLFVGMVHNLIKKKIVAAICDQLTWIVMLNSLALFGAGSMGVLSAEIGGISGKIAMVPAAMILLFSQREGGIATRLGMGAYQLFSTVFYLGDILSYLRLMALGMATGGVAMAINVIAKTVSEIPYIGFLLAILLVVGGHLFNTAMSTLGAFVHTMRLQFVEYFPKFLIGGGREFEPLSKKYRHIYLREKSEGNF